MAHKLDANELESIEIEGVGEVKPGMILDHPIFGSGEVEAIFEFIKSGDKTIRINFDKHGSKALVPEYANLSLPKRNETKSSIFGKLFKGAK